LNNKKLGVNTGTRFAAVVFDMDGVLVDSEPIHLESTTRMMRDDFGISFTSKDNREFLGSTDGQMYKTLKQRHQLKPPLEELIGRRKSIYISLLDELGIPWRDGIRELIAELPQRGLRIALASSALKHVADLTLMRGNIAQHFSAVVTGDDIPVPKPSPEIYQEAARRLQIDPAKCIAIEDTDVGVRAAKAAGMTAIAFPTPATADMDFSPADHVARDVADIRRIILP